MREARPGFVGGRQPAGSLSQLGSSRNTHRNVRGLRRCPPCARQEGLPKRLAPRAALCVQVVIGAGRAEGYFPFGGTGTASAGGDVLEVAVPAGRGPRDVRVAVAMA